MPGHDPVAVADLIKAQADLRDEGAELLTFVGDAAPVYFDVGVNVALVCLAGWNQARDPSNFLLVVHKHS